MQHNSLLQPSPSSLVLGITFSCNLLHNQIAFIFCFQCNPMALVLFSDYFIYIKVGFSYPNENTLICEQYLWCQSPKIGNLGLEPQLICYLVMLLAHNRKSQEQLATAMDCTFILILTCSLGLDRGYYPPAKITLLSPKLYLSSLVF